MKKMFLFFIFLCSSFLLFSKSIIQGRIIKVSDGDTVTLLDNNNKQIKIRLYGIDCPEKGQDYYQVAKNYVSTAIYNKEVKVEIINTDRYKRSVGIIWPTENRNLNIELLNQGLAWHYKQFDKSKQYAEAENIARNQKLNIWKHKNSQAPWEFRKNKKNKKS